MGKLKERLNLSSGELAELKSLLSKGKHSVRKLKRAQVLLRLHEGSTHAEVAEIVRVCLATVYNIHDRYLAGKLKALNEKDRPGQPH